MMNYGSAVVVEGLTVRRGRRRVLDGLDLRIPRGQVVGLLGPSGCGKTTLMRSIVGVQRIAGGRVEVLGMPAGTAALRHRVGYVTQAASVYDDLTVKQNLEYFRRVLGAGKGEVAGAIEATDLGANAGQLVSTLSGGQRSRVSLAAALLGSPDLLVLDEPTVGLDPLLRAELWGLFHRLAAAGTSLLVSSHVMDEAARCDRLLLMREGAILADRTPEELLAETGAADAEGAFLALLRRGHARHALAEEEEEGAAGGHSASGRDVGGGDVHGGRGRARARGRARKRRSRRRGPRERRGRGRRRRGRQRGRGSTRRRCTRRRQHTQRPHPQHRQRTR